MMPRLEAEEALRMTQIVQLGTGNVSKEGRADAEKVLSGWQRVAEGKPATKREERKTARARLSAAGVVVRKVRKPS